VPLKKKTLDDGLKTKFHWVNFDWLWICGFWFAENIGELLKV